MFNEHENERRGHDCLEKLEHFRMPVKPDRYGIKAQEWLST